MRGCLCVLCSRGVNKAHGLVDISLTCHPVATFLSEGNVVGAVAVGFWVYGVAVFFGKTFIHPH